MVVAAAVAAFAVVVDDAALLLFEPQADIVRAAAIATPATVILRSFNCLSFSFFG